MVPTKRSAIAFHPRGLRGGEHRGDARGGEHGIEGVGELRVPVPDQVGAPGPGLGKVGSEVAGELGGPGGGGVPGDAQEVDPAAGMFDDEGNVDAGERHCAVDVEEVRGQQRFGLGT